MELRGLLPPETEPPAHLRPSLTQEREAIEAALVESRSRVSGPRGAARLNHGSTIHLLPAEAGTTSEGRTAANNATVRTVFVVGPDKKIKLMLVYPMSTGRNFDEVLRVLDSMQLTAVHKVASPANWKNGEDVIILPAVSDEEAKQKYPEGWKALKPYLRFVPQPK
jgi:hypothetical protein